MTQTAKTTSPAVLRAAKIARQPGTSFRDVFIELRSGEQAEAGKRPEPTLPKKIELTDTQVAEITGLVPAIRSLRFPAVPRELTTAERAAALAATKQFKAAKTVIDRVITSLKAETYNHMDRLAEKDGRAKPGVTPVDDHGWYLLDDRDKGGVVPGAPEKLTREYSGGSVELTEEALQELDDAGVIPHDIYLAMTTQVRIVDEAKVLAVLAQQPELIPVLAAAAKQTRKPSTSFNVRKA